MRNFSNKITRSIYNALRILFIVLFCFISLNTVHAQQKDAGLFGEFEVKLPGIKANTVGELVRNNKPITSYLSIIFNIIIASTIIAGVISIVVGGFLYITASGEGDRVKTSKTLIISSLVGITLSLVAWLILNTISPQFAGQLQEPCIPGQKNSRGDTCPPNGRWP